MLEEAVAVLSDNSGTAISEREADRARLVQGGAEENGQIAGSCFDESGTNCKSCSD